jgi:hypothetical protein
LGGLLGAALCVVSSLGLSAGTRAEESWAFGPKPPTGGGARDYLIYELDPGDVIQDSVRLSNLGDTPLTFRVYARDATSASDGIGSPEGWLCTKITALAPSCSARRMTSRGYNGAWSTVPDCCNSSATVGALGLSSLCAEIEALARDQRVPEAAARIAEMQLEVEAVREALRDMCATADRGAGSA